MKTPKKFQRNIYTHLYVYVYVYVYIYIYILRRERERERVYIIGIYKREGQTFLKKKLRLKREREIGENYFNTGLRRMRTN